MTTRSHTPAIVALFTVTFLMWFGFFMLIPLLAVHITHNLGQGAAMAGLVLAVRQFVQQGLGLFVGPLADNWGYRNSMLIGVLVRSVGFMILAFATEPFGLMAGGIIAALGGAGFESSSKAGLAALSKNYKRENIFALSSTFGNLGMTLGPLAGVALLKLDFKVVGLASAAMYLVAFGIVWIFVPKIERVQRVGNFTPATMFAQLGAVWANRPFVMLSALMIGFYLMWVQINITLPLMAARLTGNEDSIGLLFALNSGLAIALQFVGVKLISRWLQPLTIIALGTAITTLGLAGVAFAGGFGWLLLCVVVYGLGRLLVDPLIQVLTVRYATDDTLASYFGFSALGLAFGGLLGNSLGGWLFDTAYAVNFPALPWLFFGGVGVLVSIGTLALRFSERRAARPATARAPQDRPSTNAA